MNRHHWLSFVKFKKIRGIESLIFGLVLLFFPVNLAKHFFFDFAYVDGILVDYLIPTIYLTDILIWALLGIWVFRVLKGLPKPENSSAVQTAKLCLIALILISGLSVVGAGNQPAAVYRWLKLAEYILFAFYISRNVDFKRDVFTIVKLMSVGVLFESVLAIAQWLKQGSIFGYWFLGENKYTVSTPGIATLDFFGSKKVRPYGTFPHPNALGGYLAVVLPWIAWTGLKGVKGVKDLRKRFTIYGLRFTTLVFGLVALFLSFSRAAWVVGGLGILGVLVLDFKNTLSPPRLSSVFSILHPPSSIFHPPSSIFLSLSFLRRAELNWIALKMFQNHPLLGVGLNNFTIRMGEYGEVSGWAPFLQPVHNVYLLIAAETGLLGLAAFLCLFLFAINGLRLTINDPPHHLLLISLSQSALLSFVDHYFWSLQQTALLFWLLIGLALSTRKE